MPDPHRPRPPAPGALAAPLATLAAVAAVAVLLVGCAGVKDKLTGNRSPAAGTTTIATPAVQFNAIVRGPTSAEAKKVVVFLHGGSYTSRIWDDRGILDDLTHEGYRVVAVDLPGYGKTRDQKVAEEDGGASKGTILRQLILAVGGPERVVVVSPSMSGRFSLGYLAEFPGDRLAGFVGIAPVGAARFDRPAPATKVPTELVWGSEDDQIPQSQAKTILARLPGGHLSVIEGASHAAYDDDPKAFTKILLAFLTGLPS